MSLLNRGRAMDILLEAIASGCTIKEGAKQAGVDTGAHYFWLRSDKAYAEGYKFALQIRSGRAEEEAERRAIDGYDETTTLYTILPDGTEIPVEKKVVRKYDSSLLARILVAGNPEKFSDRAKVEVNDKTSVAEILASARNRLAAARKDQDAPEETTEG